MYQSPAKLGDKISPYLFIQWKLVIPVMAYIFTIVIRYMFTIFHHAIATHTHIYIYNYGDSHFHHKITIYKYIFIMYIYIYIYFTIFHHLSHWSWLISSPQIQLATLVKKELVHRHEQEAVSDVSGKRSSVELVPCHGEFFFCGTYTLW